MVAAALSPNGVSRKVLTIARERHAIALSEAVLSEMTAVLARPKFAKALTADRRHEILELLAAAATWFEPQVRVTDCRDAKDNCYLELALAAQAGALLSADEDLLILDPWHNIPILRAADWLREAAIGTS